MARLLFLTPSFIAGGAERVILRLLREIDTERSEAHLAVLWDEGPLKCELGPRTILHDLDCRRARYALPSIVRLIRKLRPAIVFTTLSRLNVLLLASRFLLPGGTKLVIREANTPSAELARLPGGKLYRHLYRHLYPLADAIVCQSDYMQNDLVTNFGVPNSKITRIYNPVPFDMIDESANLASPLGVGFNFVTAGKLDYQKGYDVLIKAFSRVAAQLPDAKLTLVGRGDLLPQLEGLVAATGLLDRVEFAGFQLNPYPYFKHADVFVSSSRFEGLPNVVLEALACGTPVLATNCPGGTAEIVADGVNGWLVPPEDISALANGMLLAATEAQGFDRGEVRSSVACYSSAAIAEQYMKLFERLLAG